MIPFSPPRIDETIINEIIDTLKSGWITTGPKTKLFEKKITEYCGNKSTLCLNSATAGLELVLRWFGVKEGDEVILPVYTYAATANVVIHCGATPVMADVNPDDFNISIKQIEQKITGKTKVIIPVDFAGFPCDYNKINQIVNKQDIKILFKPETEIQQKLGRILILSDAAHSIGAEYYGRKTGSLTDITVFSFHAVKNLTTAEGGAIGFNLPENFDNEEVYKYFATFSLHGQNKDALAKTQLGNWKYDIIEAGYKSNMTDILASIGLIELARYETDMLKKRKNIFDFYSESLLNHNWAQLPLYETGNITSSYHVYALRIKNITEVQRDEIIQKIFNKEVSVNVHFQPLSNFTFYKNLGYKNENYPVAYDNYSREISLPVYYDLTENQLKKIISVVIESVNEILFIKN
jgi:dTDP-4-amino-4,6-dideoxygalactose transaminase